MGDSLEVQHHYGLNLKLFHEPMYKPSELACNYSSTCAMGRRQSRSGYHGTKEKTELFKFHLGFGA